MKGGKYDDSCPLTATLLNPSVQPTCADLVASISGIYMIVSHVAYMYLASRLPDVLQPIRDQVLG